jgi:isoaspartyl peptidase/L-asparaginase-like protein (Ntn-hydrolase superfamily)
MSPIIAIGAAAAAYALFKLHQSAPPAPPTTDTTGSGPHVVRPGQQIDNSIKNPIEVGGASSRVPGSSSGVCATCVDGAGQLAAPTTTGGNTQQQASGAVVGTGTSYGFSYPVSTGTAGTSGGVDPNETRKTIAVGVKTGSIYF